MVLNNRTRADTSVFDPCTSEFETFAIGQAKSTHDRGRERTWRERISNIRSFGSSETNQSWIFVIVRNEDDSVLGGDASGSV